MTEQPKMAIHVLVKRKDGKYKVRYVFPISGTGLTKIRTNEQLVEAAKRGYVIYGLDR